MNVIDKITYLSFGIGLAFLPLPLCAEITTVKPVRQLLYSLEQVERVRAIARTDEVMKKVADDFIRNADIYMRYTEEEISKLLPEPDAVFAYGFSGDPKDNSTWPRFGERLCSLDRPFAIVSPSTKDVYGLDGPGEPYHDSGKGWVRPEDGKVFYFRGIWNAFVVRRLHEAIDWLSVSYMLTGNEAYAKRALFILDRMATARAQRKGIEGPIDFPEPLLKGYGFFSFYSNHANERMYYSALAFDLLGNAPFASTPSSLSPELSVYQNIEKNYFSVDARGLFENRVSLQNHATAAYSALISQALLFGRPDDLREGLEACHGFLNNTIDRDGEYYETSGSYSELGRVYGGRMISLFEHYSPAGYKDSGKFPRNEEFPGDLKFGNSAAWRGAAVTSLYHLTVFGRPVQYGDANLDRFTKIPLANTEVYPKETANLALQRAMFLKLLYQQTDDPEWKRTFSLLYWDIPIQTRHNIWNLKKAILQYGPSQWTEPAKATGEIPKAMQERYSILLGQKRIALLKSGEGEKQRAIFMRGGSNNSHSQNDQLAIQLYAEGLALTGQYGYNLWGTPDHRGYATRGIAHKMVIVDEDLPASPLIASRPPASIDGALTSAPVQFIEMSNPGQWPASKLSDYRRQTWLIDLSDEASYFLDVAWVDGGKTHDYVWTSPFVKSAREDAFRLEGAEVKPIEGVWTLAALGGRDRNATFNQPGKSWGERLEVSSGTIRKADNAKEALNGQQWNPPPGNGYGFVWDVKKAPTENDWSATWLLHDREHSIRMKMLNPDGQDVITAKAPSLTKDGTHNVVVARRDTGKGQLRSRFVTVSQVAAADRWPIRDAQWISATRPGEVGVTIGLLDGRRDTLLISRSATAEMNGDAVKVIGKRGFVRRSTSGEPELAMLSEGTLLESEGVAIHFSAPEWKGTVRKVTPKSIVLDTALPVNGQLSGLGIVFRTPPNSPAPYASNEFFTIEHVQPLGHGETELSFASQSLISGQVVIDRKQDDGTIKSQWPNEIAAVLNGKNQQSRVFDGHQLVSSEDPEERNTIVSYSGGHQFTVSDPKRIEPGKSYDIMAAQPSDLFQIPVSCTLRRIGEGEWEIRANAGVKVRLPQKGNWLLKSDDAEKTPLSPDKDGFLKIPIETLINGTAILSSAK